MLILKYFLVVGAVLTAGLIALNAHLRQIRGDAWHDTRPLVHLQEPVPPTHERPAGYVHGNNRVEIRLDTKRQLGADADQLRKVCHRIVTSQR